MSNEDAEHSPASVVGAPPFALPVEDGGEAAVVGHPNPPASLADSPVRGDTNGLDAPWEAKPAKKTAESKTAERAPRKTAEHKPAAKKATGRSAHRR